MPQHWIFTLTFHGNLTCKTKYKRIEKIPKIFSKLINFNKNDNVDLSYTIEYHKIKGGPMNGMDNSTAPHVHGLLICDFISASLAKEIYEFFKKNYGRTEFYLVEHEAQIANWKDYMIKDVDRLNTLYKCEHFFRHTLTQPHKDNIWLEEELESDLD